MFTYFKNIFYRKNVYYLIGFVLLFYNEISAQVTAVADSTHIRIGEQFQYTISADQQQNVKFSDFKTDHSGKIEVLQTYPTDTLKNRLYKKYLLTSFDSGSYYIPAQEVMINNQRFLTDSLLINVGTVKVDTTQQGLFPIKPIYKAPPKTWHEYLWILWWILAILIFGLLMGWLAFKKKTFAFIKPKKPLTPFELAIEELKKLDAQNLLAQQKVKLYYTTLTDIIRKYMESDMHIAAMETTSDELITLIKKENIHKKLGIPAKNIQELQLFLQNADLVKFAKAQPELNKMQEDRDYTAFLLNELNRSVTDYDLRMQQQNDAQHHQHKTDETNYRKRRKVIIATGIVVFLVTAGSIIWYKGFQYAKDTVLGHPSKELLEGKWYKSSYGYPSVTIETPVILKPVPSEMSGIVAQAQAVFEYHSLIDHFKISVSTFAFNDSIPIQKEQAVEMAKTMIGNTKGVKNLQTQTETINVSGLEGVKIIAKFEVENIPVLMNEMLFINGKNMVDVSVMRKQNDQYAEQIEKRLMASLQIENISD